MSSNSIHIECLYILSFCLVIVLTIITLIVSRILFKNLQFGRFQIIYLTFTLVHCIMIYGLHYFFPDNYFINIGMPFSLFYGPLYYWGLSVLVEEEAIKFHRLKYHFLTGIIFFCVFIFLLFLDVDNKYLAGFCITVYAISCLQFFFYAFYSYAKFNLKIKDHLISSIMGQSTILLISISLIFSSLLIASPITFSYKYSRLIINVLMIISILILFGFNIISIRNRVDSAVETEDKEPLFTPSKEDSKTQEKENKYIKSRISAKQEELYAQKIEIIFIQQLYLDPEITLEKLSKELKIPKYHLTQVLNLKFNTNFNKLINKFRIEYAEKLLQDPNNNLTVTEIGSQSGFNSRSAFYRAFNLYHNINPLDYRKKYKS